MWVSGVSWVITCAGLSLHPLKRVGCEAGFSSSSEGNPSVTRLSPYPLRGVSLYPSHPAWLHSATSGVLEFVQPVLAVT